MGTKATIRIVLSLVIIIAYFLPWFQVLGSSESAFNIITQSTAGEQRTGQILWYASILIPLFALLSLIQSINKKTPGGLVRAIPFIITALFLVLLYLGVKDEGDVDTKSFFSIFGIGVYLTLIASFLLIFVGGDTVIATPTTNTNPTVKPM